MQTKNLMTKVRYPKTGAKLRSWLVSHNMNANILAEKCHLRPANVYYYVHGIFKPTATVIYKMIHYGKIPKKAVLSIFSEPQYKGFGRYIRNLRLERGLSTIEMGRRMHTEQQGACRIERLTRIPWPSTLINCAQALNMKPSALYNRYIKPNEMTLPILVEDILLDNHITPYQFKYYNLSSHIVWALTQRNIIPSPQTLVKLAVILNVNPKRLFALSPYGTKYLSTFGGKLALCMARNHITYAMLSDRIHCTRQAISNYIHNKTQIKPYMRKRIRQSIGV